MLMKNIDADKIADHFFKEKRDHDDLCDFVEQFYNFYVIWDEYGTGREYSIRNIHPGIEVTKNGQLKFFIKNKFSEIEEYFFTAQDVQTMRQLAYGKQISNEDRLKIE